MIGGGRTETHGQLGTAAGLELIRVKTWHEPVRERRFEYARRLVGGEGARLHEYVAKEGQARVRDRGDHLFANQLDVAGSVVAVLWRDGVGAEKGGHDVDPIFRGQLLDHLQHLDLVLAREAVPALDLDRRGSVLEQPP